MVEQRSATEAKFETKPGLRVRRWLVAAMGLLLVVPALPSVSAAGATDVSLILLDRGVARRGGAPDTWFISADLVGTGISTVTISSPMGGDLVLEPDGEGGFEKELSFSSEQTLLASFPNGNYTVTINGQTQAETLPFTPDVPNGFAVIESPMDDETGVFPIAMVDYNNTCTNCEARPGGAGIGTPTSLGLALGNFDTEEEFVFVNVPPTVPPEPDSEYDFELFLGQGPRYFIEANVFTQQNFQGSNFGPDLFDFFAIGTDLDVVVFMVPEPGLATLQATAVGLLVALRRRRSRG